MSNESFKTNIDRSNLMGNKDVFRASPNQTMQAMVIPIPLFSQMVELIRGNASHRDADPVLQQCAQLQPQTVNFKPPE